MSVLILSTVGDSHGRAVEWALRRRGVPVDFLMYRDFPQMLAISEHLSDDGTRRRIKHSFVGALDGKFTTVWRRRICPPMVRTDLHPADELIAQKEAQCVIDSLEMHLDDSALLSANSFRGHQLAKQKPTQLRHAISVGMPIPQTLISNDPAEIRAFSRDLHGRIILKSFTSPTWTAEDRSFFTFTRRLPPAVLRDDAALSAAPAIYQAEVEKQYEVRAFFAGRSCLAVKLDSQKQQATSADWRRCGSRNVGTEPYSLPEHVKAKCFELMASLGIVTGSFDFAVTPSGEHVFFEVNEQGQFLWIEQHCPSLPVLETFAEFLISADASYLPSHTAGDICLGAYRDSGEWELSQEAERHRHLNIQTRPAYTE